MIFKQADDGGDLAGSHRSRSVRGLVASGWLRLEPSEYPFLFRLSSGRLRYTSC